MNQIPCPARIPSDLGDAFATGCVLGSMWYFAKGAFNSVRRERFRGGITLVRNRAPVLGGSFAMWGGIFATSSCVLGYVRGVEDTKNSIASGFVTGFVLSFRNGFRPAIRNGIFGGVFLAIIEGLMIFMNMYQKREELKGKIAETDMYRREIERSYGIKSTHPKKGGEKVQVDKANRL
jgi:mitochondrial import inner membrane translocase subunit TIM17